MRILWLKAGLLLPLDKGGNLRSWHLMRHLARRHEVTFLSFAESNSASQDVDAMRAVAARVEIIPRREPRKGSLRFYLSVCLHLFDPLPYAVGQYRSRAYRRRVRQLLATTRFDLILCDFLPPAINMPRSLPCPSVLFTHNVESQIWERHAGTVRGPIRRWLYRMQYQRMERFEGRTVGRFDRVLAVSESDARALSRRYPEALSESPRVVPTGVDTSFFTGWSGTSGGEERQLVFTGSMDWLPNEDAMVFFCREILPRIQDEEPHARLAIVGRRPSATVRALSACRGVLVTGRVEDVRPHLGQASVYVVPLRVGGGTRLKIFEAMAMGKAVVSTTIGAEGLPVVDGEHLMLADDPASFARVVVELLRNSDRRLTLGRSARALVTSQYDWAQVATAFENALLPGPYDRRPDLTRGHHVPSRPFQSSEPCA
jgi:sugar transferase (PEP-CTERM/EpsH1 system associated)